MKRLIIAALGLALIGGTAYAGGRGGNQGLNVNANVVTGKGGIVGTLLGSKKGHGKQGLNVNANVATGKGGVLGLLLGGGKSRGHGW